MDLDRIAIEPRCRTSWEAIDLGFRMARVWWKPMFFWWLLPAALIYLVVALCFPETPWIAAFVLWWMKPFLDRFPLFVASRKLFGESPPLLKQLSAMRSVMFRDLFAWLLWRRFSPTRSMDMPLTILENLKGEKRARRLQVLHYRSGNAATWLTIVCLHLEGAVSFGFIGLLLWMVPEQANVDWLDIFDFESLLHEHLLNILTGLAMAMVAPFYVLAGFALYVSRRVELEGWDIEIRFRQIADRLSAANKRQSSHPVVSLLLCGMLFFSSLVLPVKEALASGLETGQQTESVEHIHEVDFSVVLLEQVMQGKDFKREKTITDWRFRNSEELQEDDEIPDWLITVVEWLENFSESTEGLRSKVGSMAFFVELVLWMAVISIVVYFLVKYRHLLGRLAGMKASAQKTEAPPEELFGLDVRRESLPEDIPVVVMALWEKKQHREALGLLFRALLVRLMHDHGLRFKDGYTERECVNIIEKSGDAELANYADVVVTAWQGLAYAHVVPETQRVRRYCEDWNKVFPDA